MPNGTFPLSISLVKEITTSQHATSQQGCVWPITQDSSRGRMHATRGIMRCTWARSVSGTRSLSMVHLDGIWRMTVGPAGSK